jgi:hypothetical protein
MANALTLLGCGVSGSVIPPSPANWILHTGHWDDDGKWRNNAVWID